MQPPLPRELRSAGSWHHLDFIESVFFFFYLVWRGWLVLSTDAIFCNSFRFFLFHLLAAALGRSLHRMYHRLNIPQRNVLSYHGMSCIISAIHQSLTPGTVHGTYSSVAQVQVRTSTMMKPCPARSFHQHHHQPVYAQNERPTRHPSTTAARTVEN